MRETLCLDERRLTRDRERAEMKKKGSGGEVSEVSMFLAERGYLSTAQPPGTDCEPPDGVCHFQLGQTSMVIIVTLSGSSEL